MWLAFSRMMIDGVQECFSVAAFGGGGVSAGKGEDRRKQKIEICLSRPDTVVAEGRQTVCQLAVVGGVLFMDIPAAGLHSGNLHPVAVDSKLHLEQVIPREGGIH